MADEEGSAGPGMAMGDRPMFLYVPCLGTAGKDLISSVHENELYTRELYIIQRETYDKFSRGASGSVC